MIGSKEFTLFDTPIGPCGIAWSARGVVGVQLPEGRHAETRARMARRFAEACEVSPPRNVRKAIEAILALLRGEPSDLSGVALDMGAVSAFHRRVYEAAQAIPPGDTLSYGEIAAGLGERGLARAVGQALGRNPAPAGPRHPGQGTRSRPVFLRWPPRRRGVILPAW